jgi:hypothetical protein
MKKATQAEYDSIKNRYNALRSYSDSQKEEIKELILIVRQLREEVEKLKLIV